VTDSNFSAELMLGGPSETEALGARIAALLAPGDTIALEGDLGAGKTTLARAILRARGSRESVPSPTFTLVQRYELPQFAVSHFDLYRIAREAEVDELGLDEALSDGAALIEWPERAGSRLPADALHVQLAIIGDTDRRASLKGPARWAKLVEHGALR
jgi:tRNA threonylcarbamoyl adenosine modification protein YjeE